MAENRGRSPARAGLGLAEWIVVLLIASVVILLVALSLPGQRENARLVSCRNHLGQIGMALGMYLQVYSGALPPLPAEPGMSPGPLAAMLRVMGEPDFSGLSPARPPVAAARDPGPVLPRRIAGLLCPSDPNAALSAFEAPVSYRANLGDDPEGTTGPFGFGREVAISSIQAADGVAYTAAFAERLVGTGRGEPSPVNYAVVPGPAGSDACPADAGRWKGDAGSDWSVASWPSTLYNHALPPNAGRSCLAADGRTARIGASSGHNGAVHVLLLDLSVRPVQSRVAPRVWKAMGNVDDAAGAPKAPAGVTVPGQAPAGPASAGGPG